MNFDDPVFFDLETTGVDTSKCEIIQIAALAPLSNDRFEVKIKFDEDDAEPEAIKMNCYDGDVWDEEAVSIPVALNEFTAFLKNHLSLKRKSRAGHEFGVAAGIGYNNLRFDNPILQRYYKSRSLFLPLDYISYDVMQLVLWTTPNLESYSLPNVAKHFNVYREGEHDAVVDTEVLADIAALILFEQGCKQKWIKRRRGQMKRRGVID